MKLTWKLTIFLVLGTLLVTALHAATRISRESALFEQDIRQDNYLLGRTIAGAARRMWETAGEVQALQLVQEANERESQVDIRWVWLDAAPGTSASPLVSRAELAPLKTERKLVLRVHQKEKGSDAVVTYVPVVIPGPRRAAIELAESLAAERAYVRKTVANIGVSMLLIVAVCGAIAMGLGVWLVGRPIRTLVEQARRVGRGDLANRIVVRRRDELAVLAHEMNAMCDRLVEAEARVATETASRLATMEQLRHADRLMTVGKLASGIAHELGTPINVISGRAQLIADEEEAGSAAHQNATIVIEQADRMAAIIRHLLDFARRRPAQKSSQPLQPVLAQTVGMLGSLAHKRGVSLALADGDPSALSAEVDVGQLQQVLTNLVVNGIHAMPQGGPLILGLERTRLTPPPEHGGAEADYLRVFVKDQGTGITPEALPRIFEPFFTTKEVGEGTGLGLSVAYGIVQEHGGWIGVESAPGRGSCFSIYLPAEARA
jgi:signal transduction histidine kinase